MPQSISHNESEVLTNALSQFAEAVRQLIGPVVEGFDVSGLEGSIEVRGHMVILHFEGHVFSLFLDSEESGASIRAAELVASYLGRGEVASSQLPKGEREAWERIGANFDDAEAVAVSRAAAAAAYEELVRRCVVGDGDVAQLLNVDRSRVSQRATAERSLYSFVDVNEQRCYPKWQFVDGKTIPGLKLVLAQLDPGLHPLTVDRWFTHPDVDLVADDVVVSPVAWLRSGGSPELAADHARFL